MCCIAVANTWSNSFGVQVPGARAGHTMTVFNNQIMMIGGNTGTGPVLFNGFNGVTNNQVTTSGEQTGAAVERLC